MAFNTYGGQTYTLQSSISSTATSITLSSFTEPVSGANITMSLMATDIAYGTIAPKTTQTEFISFTGITQNADGTATLTGVTRGLKRGSDYTSSSTFQLPHPGGTQFIISNIPEMYNKFAILADSETITGAWQFPAGGNANAPTSGASYTAPTNDLEYASKKYVDTVAIAGAPDSSTTTKGIGKVSVAPVSSTNPIFVGDNDTRVPTTAQTSALVGNNTDIAVGSGNKFVTQTGLQHNAEKYGVDTSGSSTAYVVTLSPVPTSYTAGMEFYVKIVNSNTTTTPTINFNSLGAKTIVKGTNTALAIGDILANQIITLIYDGTNMVLQNPVGTNTSTAVIAYKSGTTTKNSGDASTTQNIAHGLGIVPKYAKITAWEASILPNSPDPGSFQSFTVYNGTTQSSMSIVKTSATTSQISTTFIIGPGTTGNSDNNSGVVTWDSTNIIITWTKNGSPSSLTYTLLWEAQG